jgi:hypothetical protein
MNQKNEELNNEETTETVMENRMAMYSRALGVMGAHYSGPVVEKKADKDHDGDGKVESSKEEYFGSKDKAIKKAMAKEEVTVEEGYKSLPADKMKKQQKGKGRDGDGPAQARKMEVVRKATQGSEGMVKDAVKGQEMSNKKKGLEKKFAAPAANKSNKNKAYELEGQRRRDLDNRYGDKKEETSITKEMVIEYLVIEGYASNEVSAEILHTHVSDGFLANIEESMITELSKGTMGSYVKKAAKDVEKRSYDQAEYEADTWQSIPDKDPKIDKRHKGIDSAVKKLTK